MNTQQLKATDLTLTKELQMRLNGINKDTVTEYAEEMRKGAQFPPVVVFSADGKLLVADGFHRVKAALEAGLETVAAELHEGSKQDALNYARFVANRKNGMRLTRFDLQALVETLVTETQYAQTPNTELADIAGCSHTMIKRTRERLGRTPETIITKDGVERRSRLPVVEAEFVEGSPPTGVVAPAEGGFPDLARKVSERLEEHLDDVVQSINKLEGEELHRWLRDPARLELKEEIARLQALLEN